MNRLPRLSGGLDTPKLSAVMSLVFVCLSIPILVFILLYNYHRNSAAIVSMLHAQVAKTRQASIDNAMSLIRPVAGTLRLVADLAASDPAFFRSERSRELLYRALTSADQIDAVYVSFEDGYHRVVTRIDDDRRRSDPRIPPTANWHSSYVDAFSAGANRRRHRTFFDTWPHVVGRYAVEWTADIRTIPHYRAAKATGTLAVTEPIINLDTGYPVISLAIPIAPDGVFIGCASSNITLDLLSRFLEQHRASPRSTTIIADRTDGKIIGYPDSRKGVRMVGGQLEVARLDTIADDDVREAQQQRARADQSTFVFRSPRTGEELSAAFARFPDTFERPWEVIVLTPTDDFVGALKATNRQMVVVIALLTAVELLLIYLLSTRLSRPIESVSRQLESLEALSFERQPASEARSRVREIGQLQDAVARVRASLRSFARYAPEEIVREVAVSGNEAMLSAARRDVTALFCDLRGFTSFAEQVGPEQVVAILNDHFDALSTIIAGRGGYVVDFLGDGLFAVFGAPEPRPDHAARAVACAIEMQLTREAKNREYFTRGWPPLEMGIGINTGLAVVGNMGSSHRIKYGVVGHPVNLAARIESFTTGGQVLVSDSTHEALAGGLAADGPLQAEGKGISAPIRMWAVRRLAGEPPLELPSPVPDLVALASPMDVDLRPITGKQVDGRVSPARLLKLSATGAELRTGCPVAVFDAVQVILPPRAATATPLHGKVITVTEQPAGQRTALVRFGGLDWDTRARLGTLSRAGA